MALTSSAADADRIKACIASWIDAVQKKDIDAIGTHYASDIVAFDAVQQLQFTGWPAYAAHWKQCLEACEGQLNMSAESLTIHTGPEQAVAYGLMACGPQDSSQRVYARMTATYRRAGDGWLIAHEHFSFPIDMVTGRAMYELRPGRAGEHRPVSPIPPGMSTVTAHLVCSGASDAISFYEQAFGAKQNSCLKTPEGQVMHACLRIGESAIFISDDFPSCHASHPLHLGGTPVTLHLYVSDADATIAKAIDAGCTCIMPAQDMFWGDRYGVVQDPFGHRWSIATQQRELTQEQIEQGALDMWAQTP